MVLLCDNKRNYIATFRNKSDAEEFITGHDILSLIPRDLLLIEDIGHTFADYMAHCLNVKL